MNILQALLRCPCLEALNVRAEDTAINPWQYRDGGTCLCTAATAKAAPVIPSTSDALRAVSILRFRRLAVCDISAAGPKRR